MKLAIIAGPHRKVSQSAKVAGWIGKRLETLGHQAWILDLGNHKLPIWDDSFWDGGEYWDGIWKPIEAELKNADALVFVSPEYSGMASPGLKNFILYCNTATVGHKPVLIATVSASRGGAYPVAELRMSSYKNTKLCYIPEHIIVRDAEHVLNGPDSVSKEDSYLRDRIDFALKILVSYGDALKAVRDSGVTVKKEFANGM
ncbi:NADPH-dependent oxidoreductase [Leptospira yasudae]|uniref:NADPH-dependent oxidoreductase n=1 Tax=Leptospira yasudae TaxID=2202201 RepID=A0ABX9LZZ9_9LEPT|nr:NAD(P)H-dependent oxidoreductase [Leptospira yasudae]RHX78519.1 NADPH-dependent oxidoreductase [Leptospira yasudae]RHX91585.1 NADPH-dependent oxidoreductase [Leptospira yasudae]TGK27628.1 NADPH-dependent oxidoreductase [Leptospira yasudae]TGM06752.1 NADPH-dependent oxidoreductase [Leptospira yasudae]TGM98289.1 NADPH-dependent oxidoreductase [Leptospira yasudae]